MIMKNVRIISCDFSNNIAAGITATSYGLISNVNQPFTIRSLYWSWKCALQLAPFTNIPFESAHLQDIAISIYNNSGTGLITSQLNPFANVANNGVKINSYKPGFIPFENLWCNEDLRLDFIQRNNEAANAVHFVTSVIIIIENLF
jgi:hypothetical protein